MLLALLALLLVLTGCSSSTGTPEDRPAGDAAPAQGEAADEDAGADGADAASDDVDSDDTAAGVPVEAGGGGAGTDQDGPMMVRRTTLEVLVEDVAAAATRARATAVGAGGWVESEEVVPGTGERAGHASIVLRVPSGDLDATVTSLGELGEVTFSQSTAEDVAAEYRDVEARVATMEAGAERLRELIADAPSVESIAALERELTDREAELDALKARRQVLERDVSRSTVTLHLAEEGADQLGQARADNSFLTGLGRGWDAFTSSVTVVLTLIGALLPFLVAGALLGLPLLAWRRRRRSGSAGGTRRSARPAREGVRPDGSGLESQGDRPADAAGDPGRP